MLEVIHIALVIGLLKILIETERPVVCAGIYAGAWCLFGLITETPITFLLVGTCVAFLLAFAYFWALNRIPQRSVLWWVILIGGLLAGFA